MRILYVENHQRFARVVTTQYLSAHRVIVVSSLAAAREQLTLASVGASHFDVVLLDYDLDDGKGDALLPTLVKMMPRPRIIAVSAHERGNAALLNAGADAVCSKLRMNTIATLLENNLK